MAVADWIKMRVDLYRDPKVIVIADLLADPNGPLGRYVNQNCQCDMSVTSNVTRCATVGALVTVWGVLRRRGKRVGDDLIVEFADISVIDSIAELPGFGEAMAAVGWAIDSDEGIKLPNFFGEFNTDPSEERSTKAAERQRKYRERKAEKRDVTRDVTRVTKSNAREEKRREEKNSNKTLSESCGEQSSPPSPYLMEFPCVGSGSPVWGLTEAKAAEYRESYPGVDVIGECRKARQWVIDNPTRRKTVSGMPAFLSRWLAKVQNHGGSNGSTGNNHSGAREPIFRQIRPAGEDPSLDPSVPY